MDAMNTGFLARQLLLTELQGEAVEFKGGCLVLGDGLWAGIWEPEVISDAEEYITRVQAKADEYDTALKGLVLLVPGSMEKSDSITKLAEALFVYGYPQCEDDSTGPDMVQVLNRQPKTSSLQGCEIKKVSGADELVQEALAIQELLSSPWNTNKSELPMGCDCYLANLDGEPVGIAATVQSELASRLVVLWVKDDQRNKGVGTTLLAFCNEAAASEGKLLFSTWTYRTGKWRFFFSKMGFEEQLAAKYFLAE